MKADLFCRSQLMMVEACTVHSPNAGNSCKAVFRFEYKQQSDPHLGLLRRDPVITGATESRSCLRQTV